MRVPLVLRIDLFFFFATLVFSHQHFALLNVEFPFSFTYGPILPIMQSVVVPIMQSVTD